MSTGRPRTILIADDDLDTRIVFGTYLRHFGLRVIEASSPEEARRMLREEAPDVTLFDPTLADLWEREPLSAAVAVSARILAPEMKARLAARRIPVLQKPCSPVLILEVVQGMVTAAQATPSRSSTSAATSRIEETEPSSS